jgi:hypothetical protein
MDKNPSWEANLFKLVKKFPPPVPILSQLDPVILLAL